MLAYVFWHWPYEWVDTPGYEARLAAFHRSLAEDPPVGFRGSWAVALDGAPWLGAARGYEDWYLVNDSAALDPLDIGAVAAARKGAHDSVAREAAGGSGGLYSLRRGEPDLARGHWAAWFAKPAGTTYADLYTAVEPWTSAPGASLWERKMVLGPAPEFCLRVEHRPELPPRLGALLLPLETVWPPST